MFRRKKSDDWMLGLDIGTTKICCVIARENDGQLEVVGLGHQPTIGLSRSGVSDMRDTIHSIQSAARKAFASVPGLKIREATVGIGGEFVQCFNALGSIALPGRGRAVTADDVNRAIRVAVRKSVPKDMTVLHRIPRRFRLDDNPDITDPIGLEGSVLEVDVHIVTAQETVLRNITRCVTKAGLSVERFVIQPIAAACSVLTEEEKETGVAVAEALRRSLSSATYVFSTWRSSR